MHPRQTTASQPMSRQQPMSPCPHRAQEPRHLEATLLPDTREFSWVCTTLQLPESNDGLFTRSKGPKCGILAGLPLPTESTYYCAPPMARTPSQYRSSMGTPMPAFTLPDAKGLMHNHRRVRTGTAGTLVIFMCNHCPFVTHVGNAHGRPRCQVHPTRHRLCRDQQQRYRGVSTG